MENLFSTNYQKILRYLVAHPGDEYTEKDIQEATLISKAGVNFALRALAKDGFVVLKKKGKMSFYSVSLDDPLIRQVKVLVTLLEIKPLVDSIKELAQKIVLFGSTATGTNIEESDIDLFVLTNTPKEALSKVSRGPMAEKVQLVAKKPADYILLKKKDPVFYEEISRGLVIWEKK